MEKKHSSEWTKLMEIEKQFRTAVGSYNLNTDMEVQKSDILLALDSRSERHEQLIVTRLMSEGYIHAKAIEQVWEKLVYLVFYSVDEVAAWSIDALTRLPRSKQEDIKNDLVTLAFKYAQENVKDDLSIIFGLQLLDRMQYKNEVLEYIKRFRVFMDIDDAGIDAYIKDNTIAYSC